LAQLLAKAGRGIRNAHPSPTPKAVLEPRLANLGDAHQVHVHATVAVAVDVAIPADRLFRNDASKARFFVGFSDCRVARPLPVVDRALRHDPALPPGCGDHSHLDSVLADAIRNHRRLSVYQRHHSSCRAVVWPRPISA
jgi:hypothetical protein